VVSRLVKQGDALAVMNTWRKYHPRVAQGAAMPGKPFVAEVDGKRVKVEVRKVVQSAAEPMTERAITVAQMRAMEAKIAKEEAREEQLENIYNVRRQWERNQYNPLLKQIDKAEEDYKDLPDAEARAVVFEAARKTLAGIRTEFRAELERQANEVDLDDANAVANTIRALQQLGQEKQQAANAALAPVREIGQRAQKLLAAQQQIREALDKIQELDRVIAEARKELPALKIENVDGEFKEKLDALLAKSRSKEGPKKLESIAHQRDVIERQLTRLGREIDQTIDDERHKAERFRDRVAAVEAVRTGGAEAKSVKDMLAFIESARMLGGFAAKHWHAQVVACAAKIAKVMPELGALSIENAEHVKKLEAAEKKMAPLLELNSRVEADMRRRADALRLYAPVRIGKVSVVPPIVTLKTVRDVGNGQKEIQIKLHSTDEKVVDLHVVGEGEQVLLQNFSVWGEGRTRTQTFYAQGNRIYLKLNGVAAKEPVDQNNGWMMANGKQTDASTPWTDIPAPGESTVLLPYMFTPAPEQQGGDYNFWVARNNNNDYGEERVPGL
jgi:hypothetical protein